MITKFKDNTGLVDNSDSINNNTGVVNSKNKLEHIGVVSSYIILEIGIRGLEVHYKPNITDWLIIIGVIENM